MMMIIMGVIAPLQYVTCKGSKYYKPANISAANFDAFVNAKNRVKRQEQTASIFPIYTNIKKLRRFSRTTEAKVCDTKYKV